MLEVIPIGLIAKWGTGPELGSDSGILTDKGVICTLVGHNVSFRETLPLHVSQNETICCNQNVIAKV